MDRKILVEVLLYVHKTTGLLGTGAQDVHLDFHTAPELWIEKPGAMLLLLLLGIERLIRTESSHSLLAYVYWQQRLKSPPPTPPPPAYTLVSQRNRTEENVLKKIKWAVL